MADVVYKNKHQLIMMDSSVENKMDYDGSGSSDAKEICRRHLREQIQKLEASFEACRHPNKSQIQKLSKELNVEEDQVQFWFRNKRTQIRVRDEIIREENENIKCENDAIIKALEDSNCPPSGAPPFGIDEHNLQNMPLENLFLKTKRDQMADEVSKIKDQLIMMDSFTSVQRPSSSTSQTIQPQLLSQMDIQQLSETAVEELKRLFSAAEAIWVTSSIDGTYVIDQESYEKFTNSVKHFRNLSARVESSKYVTVVPIEATSLIQMFLDSEKWKKLFPTIVNEATTIHTLGSELPLKENCNTLQVIWEKLHVLSPLVPPREFTIVRCCQQIDEGLWIIADVSHKIVNSDQVNPCCYKRPSGCLIRALSNAQTEVIWIEHVEVDHKPDTHWMYRELLCGSSGYGAKRWIVTLERMCERMALSSLLTMPATDWGDTIATVEGRRSVMELGERMLKNFSEMLITTKKNEINGVNMWTHMNMKGQPPGLVISAASCLSIPLPPLQVFNCLRSNDVRDQWDVLCKGKIISEIARVLTGSNGNNYISIIQPTLKEDNGTSMSQGPDKKMVILQECYMDELGGMIVYAPLDMDTMSIAASGEVDPLRIQILPSGFTISSDGSKKGGTLLTLAIHVLSGGSGTSVEEADRLNGLIRKAVQSINKLFICPPE